MGDEVVGGKNLVSHGTNTAGQNECYGEYNTSTEIGYGPAYENSCIHSGVTEHSGGDTVWYNYAIASAGTITGISNANTATESVCPSGWTLPTTKQIDSNRSTSSFNPVLGGRYLNGVLDYEATHGLWWGSTAYNSAARYRLIYLSGNLSTGNLGRQAGYYIRCVSEEKTATDLTYMQDMTPTAVAFLLRL